MKNKIKKHYSDSFKFLKESKKFIIFASLIFLSSAIIGLVFPMFFRDKIFEIMIELGKLISGKTFSEIFFLIFFNNTKASLISILFGIGFAIVPIMSSMTNGYILGFISREAVKENGILTLWQLIPHGIFEFPAIILSIGIGIRIGLEAFSKKSEKSIKENFILGLKTFILIILPLLLIAAIIESLLITL